MQEILGQNLGPPKLVFPCMPLSQVMTLQWDENIHIIVIIFYILGSIGQGVKNKEKD